MRVVSEYMTESESNNGVPLKSGLAVTRGHWKWHHSIDLIEFLLAFRSNYGHILYHFLNKEILIKKYVMHTPDSRATW